ncbi:hypothetical protein E2C01_083282 [Portunus trituberculatus]|uniref:Uncharacterized protein n=1 Tax=Portunus trituberculatus TaxID=210409 RepID=A0A5B7IS14_PORTR|nr:hypothetical protein [Portunus trituberculatus]
MLEIIFKVLAIVSSFYSSRQFQVLTPACCTCLVHAIMHCSLLKKTARKFPSASPVAPQIPELPATMLSTATTVGELPSTEDKQTSQPIYLLPSYTLTVMPG